MVMPSVQSEEHDQAGMLKSVHQCAPTTNVPCAWEDHPGFGRPGMGECLAVAAARDDQDVHNVRATKHTTEQNTKCALIDALNAAIP